MSSYMNTSRFRNLLNQNTALSGNVMPKSVLEMIIAKELEQDYTNDYKRRVLAFKKDKLDRLDRETDLMRYKTDVSHQDRQDELDSRETSGMYGTLANLGTLGLALYGGSATGLRGRNPNYIYNAGRV